MSPDPPRAGELAWRLDAMERRMAEVEKKAEVLPVLAEQVKQLTERVEAVTRVLWTIAGGLILLIISVLIAAAQFGGTA